MKDQNNHLRSVLEKKVTEYESHEKEYESILKPGDCGDNIQSRVYLGSDLSLLGRHRCIFPIISSINEWLTAI